MTFNGNGAVSGGSIYCNSCTLTIIKSTFMNGRANAGGELYIYEPLADITLDSNTFQGAKSYTSGGAIYYKDTRTTQSVVFTVNKATGASSSFTQNIAT